MAKRHVSSPSCKKGNLGEKLAEIWFRVRGWQMDRHQPATRRIWRGGRIEIIEIDDGGDADYMGYHMVNLNGIDYPVYLVCEVKTVTTDTCACSNLDEQQRKWMELQPEASRFVGVYFDAHNQFQVFKYKPKGSYKFNIDNI